MKLIADSGSTKTDWALIDGDDISRFSTQGINPFHQTESWIMAVLNAELIPHIEGRIIDNVWFYGAGCTPEKSPILKDCLNKTLGKNVAVEVASDMLGAARSLLADNEGIACILGTGANSCYYDGKDIRENVSPLGYILGDEGSAAYIGKRLVGDILKQQFSEDVCQMFFSETHLDAPVIINKVYRESMPNRFLGAVSQFCQNHRDNAEIHAFLMDCFGEFFKRNIKNYHRPHLPVCFVGSIAWVYEEEIREVAATMGFLVSTVSRAPMEGLIAYHR